MSVFSKLFKNEESLEIQKLKRGEIYSTLSSGKVIIIGSNHSHSSHVMVLPIINVNSKNIVFTSGTVWTKRYDLDEKFGEVSEKNLDDIECGLTNFCMHGKQEEAIIIERKNRMNV